MMWLGGCSDPEEAILHFVRARAIFRDDCAADVCSDVELEPEQDEHQQFADVHSGMVSGLLFSSQPSSSKELSIGHLFNSPRYNDVTLEVGQRTFRAHRIVLCSWSDVFKSILAPPSATNIGELHDGASNVDKHTYRLVEEEECCKVFDQFLAFMYKESVDITQENFLPILKLSKKYDILELTLLCDKYLVDLQRDVSSAITVLRQAVEYKMEKTTRSCLGVIRTNFELVEAEELRALSGSSIRALLDGEENIVVASEFAVFEKLTPWLNDCGDEDLFMEVIRGIRFPLMTAQQLKTICATDVMKRVQEITPTFMIDTLEQHALTRESLPKIDPEYTPCPRLYLNNRATIFGKGSSKALGEDKDGFLIFDEKSSEKVVENVIKVVRNKRCGAQLELNYGYDDQESWKVQVKSIKKQGRKRKKKVTEMWGTEIALDLRNRNTNYSLAALMAKQSAEVAVQVQIGDGPSSVFVEKKVFELRKHRLSSKALFTFETPCTLPSCPLKRRIRAAILLQEDHSSAKQAAAAGGNDPDDEID